MPEENIFDLEERNKKLTDAQRRVRQKEIDDVRTILKTPTGRRLFWKIWSMSGMFREPFSLNSNQTSFCLGRISLGRDLLAIVNEANVSAFAQIQQEHISALKSKKEVKDNE